MVLIVAHHYVVYDGILSVKTAAFPAVFLAWTLFSADRRTLMAALKSLCTSLQQRQSSSEIKNVLIETQSILS
jgi:hypothetical protein